MIFRDIAEIRDQSSAMLTGWLPVADGEAGIRTILDRLAALRDRYGALPVIRRCAIAIAASYTNDDDRGNVDRLATFVRRAVIYQKDPLDAEYIQTPDVMLLEISKNGVTHGDCDDHVLLFASLAQALGIRTQIAAVKLESPTFNHVVAVSFIDDQPVTVDLCAKHGETPDYPEKILG